MPGPSYSGSDEEESDLEDTAASEVALKLRPERTARTDDSSDDSYCEDDEDHDETEETRAFDVVKLMEVCQERFEESENCDWDAFRQLQGKMQDILGDADDGPHRSSSSSAEADWLRNKSFAKMSDMLGPDFHRLLGAMCVKITNRHMLKGRKVQQLRGGGFAPKLRMAQGRLERSDWVDVQDWKKRDWKDKLRFPGAVAALEDVAPKYHKHVSTKDWLVSIGDFFWSKSSTRVNIYWCGLCLDEAAFLRFVVAVHDSADPDVFSTPLGQATVQVTWDKAKFGYFCRRVVDFVMLVLLIYIGLHSRLSHSEGGKTVPYEVLQCVNIINYGNMVMLLCEMRACWMVFGSLRPIMQPFPLLNYTIEVFICYICMKMRSDPEAENVKESWIHGHPIQLALLIFIKWIHWEMQMMSLDVFIESVLPAWHALRSPTSLRFLVFLLSLVMGTLFSYMSLPRYNRWTSTQVTPWPMSGKALEDYVDDWEGALANVFKLTLIGEFDAQEADGSDWGIAYNESSKKIRKYTIGEVAAMESHLPMLLSLYALIFGVLLMNLFIGILSEEYNKAIANLTRLTGRHKLIVGLPHLLMSYLLHRLGLCKPRQTSEDLVGGLWFAVPKGKIAEVKADHHAFGSLAPQEARRHSGATPRAAQQRRGSTLTSQGSPLTSQMAHQHSAGSGHTHSHARRREV